MNELARLVSFSFYLSDGGFPRHYRIVDRNGNPWFVVRDICRILGIKNPSDAIKNFPPEYVSTIFTIEKSYSEGGRVHKLLIINEAGLLRLITRSNKPVARELQNKIFEEILPAYRKRGINWAALPRIWEYRGEKLNFPEWRAKKQEAYFKRHPNASMEDFEQSMLPFQV